MIESGVHRGAASQRRARASRSRRRIPRSNPPPRTSTSSAARALPSSSRGCGLPCGGEASSRSQAAERPRHARRAHGHPRLWRRDRTAADGRAVTAAKKRSSERSRTWRRSKPRARLRSRLRIGTASAHALRGARRAPAVHRIGHRGADAEIHPHPTPPSACVSGVPEDRTACAWAALARTASDGPRRWRSCADSAPTTSDRAPAPQIADRPEATRLFGREAQLSR